MHTVKMNDAEHSAYLEFVESRKPATEDLAEMSFDVFCMDVLQKILQPGLDAIAGYDKLSRGVVVQLRDAAKLLEMKRHGNWTEQTWRDRFQGAVEVAAMTLKQKPYRGLNKGKGSKNAKMISLAGDMVISFQSHIKFVATWEGDMDMIAMCLKDAADHMELGCHMYEGKLKEAQEVSDMDTGSRDEIPNDVWEFIQESY